MIWISKQGFMFIFQDSHSVFWSKGRRCVKVGEVERDGNVLAVYREGAREV